MLSNQVRRAAKSNNASRAAGASASRAYSTNPFEKKCLTEVPAGKIYDFNALGDKRIEKLPISIRVLLESVLRNCDNKAVLERDLETVLDWRNTAPAQQEIPFMPARVILQDFTGVPAVVDLAAMRDAVRRLGYNSDMVNPLVPVDLVIDHSVQVDAAKTANALQFNEQMEFARNSERFAFLKWGAQAFENMRIVPPGSGIVHQVNLEYLAHVVYKNTQSGLLYPDSVVGTDSHTTMIDGLGVVGWGVGGIEAEAVMLGQPISMVLPEVIGFELTGTLPQGATATDLVLTCTQMLRKRGVVGKFVEFFGPGTANITLADRATIANMAPEYGATMGFFPVDTKTLDFLRQTGRSEEQIRRVEQVTKKLGIFTEGGKTTAEFTDVMHLDLATVVPSVAGPKRPQDRVTVDNLKKDFKICMDAPNGFKGFGVAADKKATSVKITSSRDGKEYNLTHGSTVIAAITSCTNTSNPNVIMAAGMLAKKATEKGLVVPGYVKTSLSPGSKAVTEYLKQAGLDAAFESQGFFNAGYGCMTCIGNSGELDKEVQEAVVKNDLVVSAVLSGNRNFEGRVHPNVKAAYLASPPLVVAYALAGRCDIDFAVEPLGTGKDGKPVFLKDIWPTLDEVSAVVEKTLNGAMFTKVYDEIAKGTEAWNNLKAPSGKTYEWDEKSTYIQNPPFFEHISLENKAVESISGAHVLLNLGDSITTDHISPAGDIAKNSPAARFLEERGLAKADFNTYGSRRGNDKIMVRGTFANIRLTNKMLGGKTGPQTIHVPTGETLAIYDAAALYMQSNVPTIILAGQEYGSGSSRDWAAKGPYLQGVKAVIAQSFERIHRTNLIGMGVLPLQFKDGASADSLGLTGLEKFDIDLKGGNIAPGETIVVKTQCGKSFEVKARVDTPIETEYFKAGGILQYVLKEMMKKSQQQ